MIFKNEDFKRDHKVMLRGREVALRIKRHPRARQLILRINTSGDGAEITIPKRASIKSALQMAEEKADWILQGLQEHPPRTLFEVGARVPVGGETYQLCHVPGRLGIKIQGDEIQIAGKVEHLPRRFKDWLKKKAREEIVQLVHQKAALINAAPGRVTLRDTRSRWGSCGPTGNLNFSWRLVMAPVYVLDYLVAHEVAHLKHRNHGDQFWQLTERLSGDMDAAHQWLEKHGPALHRYG